MAHLQRVVVNQQSEAYVLTRRFCTDCEGFRRIKDYSKRKIRTVFGGSVAKTIAEDGRTG